jgi:hypothetical protein
MWSTPAGAEVATTLSGLDARIEPRRVGDGPGDCRWHDAIGAATGDGIVFLQPGDRLRHDALDRWHRALVRRDGASWVLAAAAAAPYGDWWGQPDLADAAAALVATGATFPECAAWVRREAWKTACERCPSAVDDPVRAGAWLALALLGPPARSCAVVADPGAPAMQPEADVLAAVLADVASRDRAAAARLLCDVARLAAGLRIAQDGLLETLEAAARCVGPLAGGGRDGAGTARRVRLLDALLRRGRRRIWIRGAGQAGRRALAWLTARDIPVDGFLDREPVADGQTLADLPVRSATDERCLGSGQTALVIVASTHHPAITAEFLARGWSEGREFAVFEPDLDPDGAWGRP